MKKTVLTLIFLILSGPVLFGQSNRVEIIDYYGRGFTKNSSSACLSMRENDTVSYIDDDIAYSRAVISMEECLLNLPKIRQAQVSFVCCTQPDNNWITYVGVDTTLAPASAKNKNAAIRLPKEIVGKYTNLMDLLVTAIENNEGGEDYSYGHAITQYAPAQKIQKEFMAFADSNFTLLKNILTTSKYPEERAMAVTIISYYSNKKELIPDLLNALTDPEDGVRTNALRSLGILADYALYFPEKTIKIPAAPFIKLMNTISWSDRNKSSIILLSLTKNRDPQILAALKAKAFKSITDMAGWKNFAHSLPGYILLGRIVGWSEEVIMSGVNNERQAQIKEMLEAMKK